MFSSIAYHFKVAVKSMIKDKNAVGLLHNNASMEKWRNLNEKKILSVMGGHVNPDSVCSRESQYFFSWDLCTTPG